MEYFEGKKVLNGLDAHQVWQTLLRLEFNGFKIAGDAASGYKRISPEIDNRIFPTISFVNHSCFPNCRVIESQGNLVLETLCEVEEGTELKINYGFELEKHRNPITRRLGCKEEMKKSFLFSCDCVVGELE